MQQDVLKLLTPATLPHILQAAHVVQMPPALSLVKKEVFVCVSQTSQPVLVTMQQDAPKMLIPAIMEFVNAPLTNPHSSHVKLAAHA
jgi:hypothetical protein